MFATACKCCTCNFESEDLGIFFEIEGKSICANCNDDCEVVRECQYCGYRSMNFDYIHSVKINKYETSYVCSHCMDVCFRCRGQGCNYCLMTGY